MNKSKVNSIWVITKNDKPALVVEKKLSFAERLRNLFCKAHIKNIELK